MVLKGVVQQIALYFKLIVVPIQITKPALTL